MDHAAVMKHVDKKSKIVRYIPAALCIEYPEDITICNRIIKDNLTDSGVRVVYDDIYQRMLETGTVSIVEDSIRGGNSEGYRAVLMLADDIYDKGEIK